MEALCFAGVWHVVIGSTRDARIHSRLAAVLSFRTWRTRLDAVGAVPAGLAGLAKKCTTYAISFILRSGNARFTDFAFTYVAIIYACCSTLLAFAGT